MENNPLVSVIMPLYNAALYVEEAVNSVINQTYADWKFFVDVLILKNKTLQHIPITIANYDATGISSANTNINKQCLQREHQEIFKDLIPERIRKDYEKALQLYNDIYRIKWLLKRPLLYKLFRITTALEMKIFK